MLAVQVVVILWLYSCGCHSDNDIMEEWEGETVRERDWVEYSSVRLAGIISQLTRWHPFYCFCRKLYSFSRQTSFGDFIYEETPELMKYQV